LPIGLAMEGSLTPTVIKRKEAINGPSPTRRLFRRLIASRKYSQSGH
jgi:hypothetical protein